MLLSRQKSENIRFICPYCGMCFSLQDNYNRTIDHVIPKSMWREFRRTQTYDERTNRKISTVNDNRNMIYCCRRCNINKGSMFMVPNWHVRGVFRFWETYDLREFAGYFYYWRLCFIENFSSAMKIDDISELELNHCSRILKDIGTFIYQYELRVKNSYWYIDDM